MSCLLTNVAASPIKINDQVGFTTREFTRNVKVPVAPDYASCLFIVLESKIRLPNRRHAYRNHFTLYRTTNSVIVARTETTQKFVDNDAVIKFDRIRPKHDQMMSRATLVNGRVNVSYDIIDYANDMPACIKHENFELLYSGEWWHFEKGTILNGMSRYHSDTPTQHVLIYYELHPKILIQNHKSVPTKPLHPETQLLLNSNNASHYQRSTDVKINDSDRELLFDSISPQHQPDKNTSYLEQLVSNIQQRVNYTYSQDEIIEDPITAMAPALDPNLVGSVLNNLQQTLILHNDQEYVNKPLNSAVVPCLYWFNKRIGELDKADISYFLPQ